MHRFITYICGLYVVLSIISLIAVRQAFRERIYTYVYILISAGILIYFTIMWNSDFNGVWDKNRQYSFGLLLSWLLFMVIVSIFVILNGVGDLIEIVFRKKGEGFSESRRKFISMVGLGIASIPFAGMIYGMVKGKYNFGVKKYTLFFDDLPKEFDGYKITQVSDIHCGSFDDREKVLYGVELANEQNSDVLFFTGDLVNNMASELKEWKDVLGRFKAKDGVYSILGNHDYGDYVQWNSMKEKVNNLEELKRIEREMGYRLLLNENVRIERGDSHINVVGVENWGKGFLQKGDLDKASAGIKDGEFNILLSHDPTHFEEKVINYGKKMHLTLSGHTHGMQFGIEIPGVLKWSPASLRYKYWWGLYEEEGRYINVNRGFGYLGFPGRVGMEPEITVIELRRSEK